MVVLEGGGMLTSGSNQYLQPDYLSPLPTTLDAKKSPLALLAQTCSQIGVDSPSSKPLIPPLEKPKKGSESSSVSPPAKPASRSSPAEPKLAFKPYEANVLSKKDDSRPSSKTNAELEVDKKSSSRAPSRKSASPPSSTSVSTPDASKTTTTTSSSGSPTNGSSTPGATATSEATKSASPEGASPIIRSGLEILHGHPKDLPLGTYKSALTSSLSSSLCSGCPPGLEPTNPAFRPPFAGGPYSHHHAAMLGYPSTPGPYVSYARVKTASGSEALVPVCKDPYCTGCQYSAHQQLMMCPSGCTQCDHHKYGLALSGLMAPPPPLSYSRPYVCNWIVGESYCGKRFTTSEELLQHLRTHTSLSSDAASMSLLNPHSFLQRYPNPPLSPLSAARYHPYSKPALPGALAASPFSAFNPTALGPYYPYSLYGQRIGAAVHP